MTHKIDRPVVARAAVLDDAHLGDIRGALGTIRQHDIAAAPHWGGA